MRILGLIVLATGSFWGTVAAQDHHEEHAKEHPAKADARHAEIRVYLAGKDKKPVGLEGIAATVIIEPEGAKKRVLKTKVVTPEGARKTGLGHGGEVREMGDYHVEFVVVRPHGEHAEAHGGGHEEEGESEHKGKHADEDEADATPFFGAAIDLVRGYTCGMTGHPVFDEDPGKCTKCSMVTNPVELSFSAVIIFRIAGETHNVKGFEYPPAIPDNYADAVAKIEEHLAAIHELIERGSLAKVHQVAARISHICEKLPELAPAEDRPEIQELCRSIIALFKEIDLVADAGKKEATERVLAKYEAKVKSLQKGATKHEGTEKGGHHD